MFSCPHPVWAMPPELGPQSHTSPILNCDRLLLPCNVRRGPEMPALL